MSKIKLIFCMLIIFSSINTFGQISVGVDFGTQMPFVAGEGWKNGYGFLASIGSESLGIGLRSGYQSFSGKSADIKLSIIPITLYYLTYLGKDQEKKFRFFYGGEIGGYSYKSEGEISGNDISASKIYFGGAAEFGANYKITEKIGASLALKYSYIMSKDAFSIFGMNIGFRYIFK